MLFSLLFLAFSTPLARNVSYSDEQTLLQFKAALTGNNSLPNWTRNTSLCKWRGITCSPPPMRIRVVGLNLSSMGLEGTISPVLGNLSALQSLDLSHNALRGRIPPQLGQLSRTKVLRLSGNQLEGNIPPSLGRCSSLVKLSVTYNQLQGGIPPELGFLPRLEMLYLGVNRLTEYGLGENVSIKGDVYSYGILLLEMVTRKKPTDTIFVGDLNLRRWVRSAFPNSLIDVVDNQLLRNLTMEQHRCLISFIHIGLLCSHDSPQDRPPMRDVGRALESLRATFMGSAATTSDLRTPILDLVSAPSTSHAPNEALSDSQSSTY